MRIIYVPSRQSQAYKLHPKIRLVCKVSNNMKVLTVLLYISLYTIIWAHTELLNNIDNAQLLCHGTV
jgi:hypothetical protein